MMDSKIQKTPKNFSRISFSLPPVVFSEKDREGQFSHSRDFLAQLARKYTSKPEN